MAAAGPVPAGPVSGFRRTTAVSPLGEGRYACAFDGGWSTLAGINGGILMATMVRALEAELGPGRALRSLQCQFLRPPKAAPAEIHLDVIRAGRRATNVRVRVEQDGRAMVEAIATCFTGGLREIARWSPPLPPADRPIDLGEREADPRRPAVADHLVYQPCIGPPPLSGMALAPGEPARTGGWLELRDPSPIEPALLAFFIDAWWPAALGPVSTLSFNPSVDLTLHVRTALPPEGLPSQPLLLDVVTHASLEGFCDEDARLFTADGTLLAQARQLAITLTPDDRPPVTKTSQGALH